MQNLMKELGFALRGLRNSPAFAVTAIATLALGIGATTAIFSVVNAVLLKPLPYREPERLTLLWTDLRSRNVTDYPFSPGDFRDLVAQNTAFSGIAAMQAGRLPVTDDVQRPEVASFAFVTWNVFNVLGITPVLGRGFVEADGIPQPPPPQQGPGNPNAPAQQQVQQAQVQAPRLPTIVVLSHSLWQRRYGGDSALVGKTIRFGQQTATVVGIAPSSAELIFPPKANIERRPDVWVVMRLNLDNASHINHSMRVIARLKDGVSLSTAQAQVDQLAADLRQRFPIKTTAGMYLRVEPMLDDVVRNVQRPLQLLFGAVGFVLLIACANVANLLLVRASARERELAVRAALGGSRWMLVRQMLSESLVLATIGGGLGLLLAQAGIDLFAAIAPTNLPRVTDVRIDGWVLGFSALASVTAAVIFGLVPALRASRPNVQDVLRGGRAASQFGGARARNAVVVAEVALSFILLVGTGLMLRTFLAVASTDVGFDPNNVLSFSVRNTRVNSQESGDAFIRTFKTRLLAIPGVTHVSAANKLPLDLGPGSGRWVPEAKATDETAFRQAEWYFVDDDYFATMKTRMIAGRAITRADRPNPPPLPQNATPAQQQAAQALQLNTPIPVVVDDQLARRLGPGAAVGQRIRSRIGGTEMNLFEVVGVVQHQRHTTLTAEEREEVFFPDNVVSGKWLVRTSRGMTGLVPQVRAALAEVDALVPITEVQPLTFYTDRALAGTRFAFVMLGLFAVIAVVLASVGLYGVLASAVRQRTAEIGVRMAFGAPSSSIFQLVIGQGLRLSVIGVVIGAGGALLMTGAMKSMLVGVKPTDPVTYAAIALLFIAIAGVACWVPARRAAALDPNVALQHE